MPNFTKFNVFCRVFQKLWPILRPITSCLCRDVLFFCSCRTGSGIGQTLAHSHFTSRRPVTSPCNFFDIITKSKTGPIFVVSPGCLLFSRDKREQLAYALFYCTVRPFITQQFKTCYYSPTSTIIHITISFYIHF